MNELSAMPTGKGFDGLEFEDGAISYQRIEEVTLVKGVERDIHRLFETHVGHAMREFLLVDPLVEKSAKFVVNRKYVPHHFKRQLAEFVLREPAYRRAKRDGHKLLRDQRVGQTRHFSELNLGKKMGGRKMKIRSRKIGFPSLPAWVSIPTHSAHHFSVFHFSAFHFRSDQCLSARFPRATRRTSARSTN